MSAAPDGPPMTVLFDTRERHFAQNPYLCHLRDALAPEVRVEGFSWRRALLGSYDLVHLHWPEYVLRPGDPRLRPLARRLARLWLGRLRRRGVPVVRTMHDLRPLVAIDAAEARLLGDLAGLTGSRIWLTAPNGAGPAAGIAPEDAVIAHGDYLPWLADQARLDPPRDPRPGDRGDELARLLCFGILRPYKRFETVIDAVGGLPDGSSVTLRVLGDAPDAGYRAELHRAADGAGDRVELLARRAGDRELFTALRLADLVVVPYDELYNSGVVLLALSAQRPVALRDGPTARELRDEFGADWVHLWSGELDAAGLAELLDRAHRPQRPLDMRELRGWPIVGERHRTLYATAVGAG